MKTNNQLMNINSKKAELITNQKSINYLLFRVNKRIEQIFSKQKMRHKDIFSLVKECENGIPTKLEVKAYEEIKIRFRDLIYTLSIR